MDRREFLRSLVATGAAVSGVGLTSCRGEQTAQGHHASPPPERSGSASRSSTTTDTAAANPFPGLGPRQLAGQRVIFSYPGLTVPQELLDEIAYGKCGGVIFFGQNISSETQLKGQVARLVAAQRQSPVRLPLLLMTDQEGGEVNRLPPPPSWSEKQIGSSSDPVTSARLAGQRGGANLAGVGLNQDLAPVLDVYYQAGNFIDQYQRSYSNKASVASECGAAFIPGLQGKKVAATAKHFPGLGAAARGQNTDLEPVTLDVSADELRTKDEVPYHAAVTAGVKLVMCSWAVYPALDPKYPAGLSETIVQGELRQRVKFQGVTITDALEAGALQSWGSYGQRAVQAAKVGMDLILCSVQDVSQGRDAVGALTTAYENGQLDSGRFNRAIQRIADLRTWL